MFLHQFGCDADDVLTFPVFDHVERLQRADDVALCYAGHLAVGETETLCDLCIIVKACAKMCDEYTWRGLLLRPHRCPWPT